MQLERDPKHEFFNTPKNNRKKSNLSWTFDTVKNIDKICDSDEYKRQIKD